MERESSDPYVVLGVPRQASLLEIARARRRLAKRFHPDLAPGDAGARQMQAINAAWKTLSDPIRRRAWDGATVAGQGTGPPRWGGPGQSTWRYDAPHAVWRHRDEPSSSRVGWFVLGGASLFLVLILVAGVVAAVDGPSMPGRDSPVLQNSLDRPGEP